MLPPDVFFSVGVPRSLDNRETVLDRSHLPFKNPGRCSMSRRLAHLMGKVYTQPWPSACSSGGAGPPLSPSPTCQNKQMLEIRKRRPPHVQPSAHMCFLRIVSGQRRQV